MTIPARLPNATGRFLQLEVVGYEFAIAGGDVNRMGVVEVGGSDANWLMVKLQAGDGETSWRSVSPALEDYDLLRLVIWLRSLADGLESVDSAWELALGSRWAPGSSVDPGRGGTEDVAISEMFPPSF